MISRKIFVIGAGDLPSDQIRAGSTALSKSWPATLNEYSSEQDAKEALASLNSSEGLACVLGDVAVMQPFGSNWIEVLSSFKQPVILLSVPKPNGIIPGSASAYIALCNALSVPVLGIVQLGGDWDSSARRLDGLPWCGCLEEEIISTSSSDKFKKDACLDVEEIIFRLKAKLFSLSL